MSFLKNAEKGKNLFSLYILTVILVIIGYAIIGQLPMLIDLAVNKYDLTQPGSGEVKQLSASNTIDIQELISGIYILEITSKSGQVGRVKFIKE